MADSAASSKSHERRARSTRRPESTVSPETENKLARAARSAQRLAQLSGVSRDDSTLDLFPDDPTLAALEAMTIDVRQGTLTGFELPPEVRAAVGLVGDADVSTGAQEAKAARRVTRAARADDSASASVQASVLDEREEPTLRLGFADERGVEAVVDSPVMPLTSAAVTAQDVAATKADAASAKDEAGSRAASVSSAALRSVAAARAGEAASQASSVSTLARAATDASLKANDDGAVSAADAAASAPASDTATARVASRSSVTKASTSDAVPSNASTANPSATSGSTATRSYADPSTGASTHAIPELDRARATAFADTVDALYGVIADQRRAATDHSRRVKWMLSIMVGALLVTVAIGIAQTMLLVRLTRETTMQQQRIEQMMLNQQATLSTLLDTDSATVSAPAFSAPAPAPAAAAPAPRVVAPQPAKRPAKPHHPHKTKPAASH